MSTCSRNEQPLHYLYNFNGAQIKRVTAVRDLGVTFDRTLSFPKHIDTICSKSYKNLEFVLRSCQNLNQSIAEICLFCFHA